MGKVIPDGTEVIVDRAAVPVRKHVIYDANPNTVPYYGIIERSDLWDDGEYRYAVKVRGGKSIYPVRHRHLQIYKK